MNIKASLIKGLNMCSLLDGLDEILDDAFFDELTRLSIEDNNGDDSPRLNEFLASQKENYNNLIKGT